MRCKKDRLKKENKTQKPKKKKFTFHFNLSTIFKPPANA